MARRLLLWLRSHWPRRSSTTIATVDPAIAQHDRIAAEIERDQSEIEARLRVLEWQADPRGRLPHD